MRRRPIGVFDVSAEVHDDGIRLTWELPDDPTIKGIEVRNIANDYDVRIYNEHYPLLAPTETGFLMRDYITGAYPQCFYIRTFNDYGIDANWLPDVCFMENELPICTPASLYANAYIQSGILKVSFYGCEPSNVTIIRHTPTAEGIITSWLRQPCRWDEGEGRQTSWQWRCDYEDVNVEPGKWYVYELTQTLRGGRKHVDVDAVQVPPAPQVP